MTSHEQQGAAVLAGCYLMIDCYAARTRTYIHAGNAEMAARSATSAATEAGYAAWVQAKLAGTPMLAPMSPRPYDYWRDTAHCQHRSEPF